MPSLLVVSGPGAGSELPLLEGNNRLGSDSENELLFSDPTVSGHHCEIEVGEGPTLLRDTDSTNGTFLEGEPVQLAPLRTGQRIQLGPWTLEYHDGAPAAPPAAAPSAAPSLHCHRHPEAAVAWVCSRCHQLLCNACAPVRKTGRRELHVCAACGGQAVHYGATPAAIGRDDRSFFARLPGALAYPFLGNGWVLLLAGAVFLSLAGFVLRYAMILGTMGSVVIVGYLCAFFQAVVQSSAQGEDEMPQWPDFGNMWEDIVRPAFLWFAILAVCFGPALIFAFMLANQGVKDGTPSPSTALGFLLSLGAGAVYFPMAVLAVAMADSLAGLNPLVVIPAIVRVAGAYAATCLLLAALLALRFVIDLAAAALAAVPVVPGLVQHFMFLYCLAVICRTLGLVHHAHRARLGWF